MPAFNVMYSAMDNVGINFTVTNTDDSGINIQNYTVYEGALVLNQDAYIGHMQFDDIKEGQKFTLEQTKTNT